MMMKKMGLIIKIERSDNARLSFGASWPTCGRPARRRINKIREAIRFSLESIDREKA